VGRLEETDGTERHPPGHPPSVTHQRQNFRSNRRGGRLEVGGRRGVL
jgi:hypothetical protein